MHDRCACLASPLQHTSICLRVWCSLYAIQGAPHPYLRYVPGPQEVRWVRPASAARTLGTSFCLLNYFVYSITLFTQLNYFVYSITLFTSCGLGRYLSYVPPRGPSTYPAYLPGLGRYLAYVLGPVEVRQGKYQVGRYAPVREGPRQLSVARRCLWSPACLPACLCLSLPLACCPPPYSLLPTACLQGGKTRAEGRKLPPPIPLLPTKCLWSCLPLSATPHALKDGDASRARHMTTTSIFWPG